MSVMFPRSTLTGVAVCIALYLVLVRYLRQYNIRKILRKYAAFVKDPYSMDYKTAFDVLHSAIMYDFETTYAFSTQFALIKSYAVARGTKLLTQTRRLTDPQKVGRRSEDTCILLAEIVMGGIDSDRGRRALAKINWLHRQYRGHITNDDMLYTLSLFILEPIRWGETVEWRKWTPLESVAVFTYWREIGCRMGISGIPETIPQLQRWTEAFAVDNLEFAESNVECTAAALDLFLRPLPPRLRWIGRQVCTCLVEEYVRPMIGLSHPHWLVAAVVDSLLRARAFVVRHCMLPRLYRKNYLGRQDGSGRIRRDVYVFEPWYVGETFWNSTRRLIPGLASGPLPGPEFLSGGYLPEEVGPQEYVEYSRLPVAREAEEMAEYARKGGASGNGCPFIFSG